nr:hypothetical protein [Escherichia coli]
MNDISSDDIFLLKQRLAEQEALIHALQEKLSNREREIDHLQAQLDTATLPIPSPNGSPLVGRVCKVNTFRPACEPTAIR